MADRDAAWSHDVTVQPQYAIEFLLHTPEHAQVLLSASTRNAAALIGITDTGTIAVRKTADFLVLDANPLDDITNTRRINAVYLRGAQVDRAGLRARWTSATSSR